MLNRAPTPFAALRDVPPSLKLVQVIFARVLINVRIELPAKRLLPGSICPLLEHLKLVDKPLFLDAVRAFEKAGQEF